MPAAFAQNQAKMQETLLEQQKEMQMQRLMDQARSFYQRMNTQAMEARVPREAKA